MLRVDAQDVIRIGRSPGGDHFTSLVDSVIRAAAYFHKLPQAQLSTNQRTNVPDGGVDTLVDAPMAGDATGWFGCPSVWQYKAQASRDILVGGLRREVNKPFVKECVLKGYGYRICICDDFSASKKKRYLAALSAEISKINPKASAPSVISAGDLAGWISQYPSLVMQHFRPNLAEMALHFEAWQSNVRATTPTYVPVKDWGTMQDAISKHVDFSAAPGQAVLSIQGQAGVGKTRLAFEVLAGIPNARHLILYADDDAEALRIARVLANDASLKSILVVDECPVQQRLDLENLLRGHRERARVIAIDNTGIRSASGSPEHRLEKMPIETVSEILIKNFPLIPSERRRAYAEKSGGFVRFAAYLCSRDVEIARVGDIASGLIDIHRYCFQDDRIPAEQKEVLCAISLVTRVGFKGDVAQELKLLCDMLKLDHAGTVALANKMHEVPGFIGRGGRYFYVTPEVVAQLAFQEAWNRWAAATPERFLADIPATLLESFNLRVSASATKEVRGLVADFFRAWARSLTPDQLTSLPTTTRLVTLTEMAPEVFLPILRNLVETAADDQLKKISGESHGSGNWGPRRILVWLMERLMRFEEHFASCEQILLRLALAESEPSIGNNASKIWGQAFRIFLSGTSVPFPERLAILRTRIISEDEPTRKLGLQVLDALLETHFTRMAGPTVIGGKIPPEDWRPKSRDEEKQCWDSVVDLLIDLFNHDQVNVRQGSLAVIIENIRRLLLLGYLPKLQERLPFEALKDSERIAVRGHIEEFLQYDCSPESKRAQVPKEYATQAREWLESFKPKDFRGKLIALLGVDPWHHATLNSEREWEREIQELAQGFLANPALLEAHIEWLLSPVAKSAAVFGQKLGLTDKNGVFLQIILDACLKRGVSTLGSGYIMGLSESSPESRTRVNAWLDTTQTHSPELAYQMFMAAPEYTDGFSRLLALFDVGKLGSAAFHAVLYGGSRRGLGVDKYEAVLKRLVVAAESGDGVARQIAIQFVGFELKDEQSSMPKDSPEIFERPGIVDLCWRLLEVETTDNDNESYWWARILDAIGPRNPERTAKICFRGLVADGFHIEQDCSRILSILAKNHPDLVMRQFGDAILDEKGGWKFRVETHSDILANLPADVVVKWLKEKGLKGARAIAQHLPQPGRDADGKPFIHPITEYVLRTFEADDEVFHSFCSGTHNMQTYSGDIAGQHDAEASFAKGLLKHPLHRVREWARYEIQSAEKNADWWREHDAEDDLQ